MHLVPADLSRYVKPHLSPVLCALLTGKDSSVQVRALAAALIARCVAQCSDSAALDVLLDAMRAAADGSGDMKAAHLGLLKGVSAVHGGLRAASTRGLPAPAALGIAAKCVDLATYLFAGRATVTVRIEAVQEMGRFAGATAAIVERADGTAPPPPQLAAIFTSIARGLKEGGYEPKGVTAFACAAALASREVGAWVAPLFAERLQKPLEQVRLFYVPLHFTRESC